MKQLFLPSTTHARSNTGPRRQPMAGFAALALLALCAGGCGTIELLETDAGAPEPGDLCEQVDCSSLDSACNVGICDPTSGTCAVVPAGDGTTCEDGDLCTTGDVCTAGVCSGQALDCSGLDGTCGIGVCNPDTGACEEELEPEGTTCDDGDACTENDACTLQGTCAGTSICGPPPADAIFVDGPFTDTVRRGGNGGVAHEDACPDGQVLIGFEGFIRPSANFMEGIRGVCGTVTLSDTTVTVGAGARLPLRGRTTSISFKRTCAANQMVIGFRGRSGTLIDQLVFRCAPLVVTTGSQLGLAVGNATDLSAAGGSGGSAFAQTNCPAGQIAAEARTRSGDSLDGFGLGCRQPRLGPAQAQIRQNCISTSSIIQAFVGEGCHELTDDAATLVSWLDLFSGSRATLYRDPGCTGPSRDVTTASLDLCGQQFSDGSDINDNVESIRLFRQ